MFFLLFIQIPFPAVHLGIGEEYFLRNLYVYAIDRDDIGDNIAVFIFDAPVIPAFLPFLHFYDLQSQNLRGPEIGDHGYFAI